MHHINQQNNKKQHSHSKKNSHSQKNAQKGFTLIELLVVVAILGIIAVVGIPQYQGYQAQAKINAVKTTNTNVVNFISAEFAKCSAGATHVLDGLTGETACSDTIANIAAGFESYANAQGWANPYDSTVDSVIDGAAGTTVGTTYVTGTTVSSVDQISVISYWTGGNTTAVVLIKE